MDSIYNFLPGFAFAMPMSVVIFPLPAQASIFMVTLGRGSCGVFIIAVCSFDVSNSVTPVTVSCIYSTIQAIFFQKIASMME